MKIYRTVDENEFKSILEKGIVTNTARKAKYSMDAGFWLKHPRIMSYYYQDNPSVAIVQAELPKNHQAVGYVTRERNPSIIGDGYGIKGNIVVESICVLHKTKSGNFAEYSEKVEEIRQNPPDWAKKYAIYIPFEYDAYGSPIEAYIGFPQRDWSDEHIEELLANKTLPSESLIEHFKKYDTKGVNIFEKIPACKRAEEALAAVESVLECVSNFQNELKSMLDGIKNDLNSEISSQEDIAKKLSNIADKFKMFEGSYHLRTNEFLWTKDDSVKSNKKNSPANCLNKIMAAAERGSLLVTKNVPNPTNPNTYQIPSVKTIP